LIRPTDSPSPDPAFAEAELREGIEASRELVKKSHVLIELSECEAALPPAATDRKAPR
jgi:hypothetical protein